MDSRTGNSPCPGSRIRRKRTRAPRAVERESARDSAARAAAGSSPTRAGRSALHASARSTRPRDASPQAQGGIQPATRSICAEMRTTCVEVPTTFSRANWLEVPQRHVRLLHLLSDAELVARVRGVLNCVPTGSQAADQQFALVDHLRGQMVMQVDEVDLVAWKREVISHEELFID